MTPELKRLWLELERTSSTSSKPVEVYLEDLQSNLALGRNQLLEQLAQLTSMGILCELNNADLERLAEGRCLEGLISAIVLTAEHWIYIRILPIDEVRRKLSAPLREELLRTNAFLSQLTAQLQ